MLLPLVLPPVVGGIALLYTFGRRGLLGETLEVLGLQIAFSTTAVVMAQTFVALPFLVVSLEGALRTAGQRYEVVAASLGARPTTVFRRVTLPLVLPGLVSGAVLSFARALGEFGATITFAGSLQGVTRTLPLEIYLRRETDADAAVALSLVLVVVAVVVIGFARQGRSSAVTLDVRRARAPSAASRSPSRSPTARPSRCSGPTAPASRPCSRCVAGLLRPGPRHGRARRPAADRRRRPGRHPHLGARRTTGRSRLLAQEPLLFPHLTVLDNVAFGPRSRGVGRGRVPDVARALARRGRRRRPRRPPARRSSPAARPSASRSPGRWPPTRGCCCSTSRWPRSTSPSRPRCARRCAGCCADRTAVVVTHDVLDALLLADRVVVIEDGRVVERGTRAEVLARPRSAFAARIAGLNMLAGTWQDGAVATTVGRRVDGRRRRPAGPGRRGRGGGGVPADGRLGVPRPPRAAAPATRSRSPSPSSSRSGDRVRVRAAELSADITPQAVADLDLAPGTAVIFTVKATEVSVYPT